MLEADRTYRRSPHPTTKRTAEEARVAYLAARDWHRGRSLEEVTARAELVPTEYTDPRTVDLFGHQLPAQTHQTHHQNRNLFGDD